MAEHNSINDHGLFVGLLEAVPLPVFVVDRTLKIRFFNQHAQRLCQPAVLAEGQHLEEVIQDSAVMQLVKQSIRTEQLQRKQYERGASKITWRISVTPLKQDSGQEIANEAQPGACAPIEHEEIASTEYQYFALMIEDMAELRRLERMQQDFIANISHELRTPLTSVRLMAETLEDTIETNHDKAQEFVEKIENEIAYLSSLVAELLELSRIESGQMPMTIEPVEAEKLVREVMARMLPLAQRHRVSLRTEIQQGSTQVAADSKLITRVLFNLVHNAIKFTPSGGTIVMGTLPAPQAGQYLQSFFVRDTGVGIREEELARVFERFYKADRARAKANYVGPGGGGTGLGLAIARQVVEAHGGRISVESIVDKGSTFTFTLPVVQKQQEKP
jgi:two-component system, OmpR family, phosphate regulon sensor histidine kinase PhoR